MSSNIHAEGGRCSIGDINHRRFVLSVQLYHERSDCGLAVASCRGVKENETRPAFGRRKSTRGAVSAGGAGSTQNFELVF